MIIISVVMITQVVIIKILIVVDSWMLQFYCQYYITANTNIHIKIYRLLIVGPVRRKKPKRTYHTKSRDNSFSVCLWILLHDAISFHSSHSSAATNNTSP